MQLVVDANIVFAMIITKGKTFELFFKKDLDLFSPSFVFEELESYKELILKKSGLSENDFLEIISRIKNKITIISEENLLDYREKAISICPDIKDVLYFALCLYLKIPLWSNDKLLKTQNLIKVYSTEDLINILD